MKTLRQWRRVYGVGLTTLLLTVGTAVSAQQQGATTQYGELDFGTRQYYPQGCSHNGNTAVCTFVFVQQGQSEAIHIGWELRGIQFVDDSHVPHNPSAAYFVDNYGARQNNMSVNRGDQGTMMVEFSQVDPQVASGSFTIGQQLIGGIPVVQGSGGQLGAANTLAGLGGAPGCAGPSRSQHAVDQQVDDPWQHPPRCRSAAEPGDTGLQHAADGQQPGVQAQQQDQHRDEQREQRRGCRSRAGQCGEAARRYSGRPVQEIRPGAGCDPASASGGSVAAALRRAYGGSFPA
jgi:hypothetical protein